MFIITRPLTTALVFAGLLAATTLAPPAKPRPICAFPDVCLHA